jgi:thioesterase domain-containing protein
MLEALFMNHPPLVMRLRQIFGFALPRALFDNTRSRLAALQNYAPVNYPGRVMLFRALDVPLLSGGDESLGWNEIVNDGVEVVFVPGDPETMFHHPNVEVFGKRLRQALQLAEGCP